MSVVGILGGAGAIWDGTEGVYGRRGDGGRDSFDATIF